MRPCERSYALALLPGLLACVSALRCDDHSTHCVSEEARCILTQHLYYQLQGVELEKLLLVNLREINRFFNDETAMEQYQVRSAQKSTSLSISCTSVPQNPDRHALSVHTSTAGFFSSLHMLTSLPPCRQSLVLSLVSGQHRPGYAPSPPHTRRPPLHHAHHRHTQDPSACRCHAPAC